MPRRALRALLLVGMLLVTAAAVLAVGPPAGDIANYHVAAWLLRHGADLSMIYDYRWFTDQAVDVGYLDQLVGFAVLTPPSALVFAPIANRSPEGVATTWMLVEGLLIALTAWQLARAGDKPAWWGFLPLLAVAPALRAHLEQGQIHLLVLAAVAVAGTLWGTRTGARGGSAGQLGAGIAIGAAVVLKIHAWPLLLVALLARQWAVLAGAVVGGGGLLALSLGAMGVEVHRQWLTEIAPRAALGMFGDPWNLSYQSLGHALRRGVLAHPALNPLPAWPSGGFLLSLPQGLMVLLVGLSALPALAWPRLSDRERAGTLAAASVAAMVGGPLLARYHLVLLAPALGWVAATLPRRRALALAGLALLATGLPVPGTQDLGALFLVGVPRFWLCLLLWVGLYPWSALRAHAHASSHGRAGIAVVAVLALLASALPQPAAAPDGAFPVDDPGLPLIASELTLADDGRLLLSGLTADRQGQPGQGWVGYAWDPDGGAPEIVAASTFTHAWAPKPGGSFSGGATGYLGPDLVPGPEDGQLAAKDGDVYWLAPNGVAVPVTTDPAWDDWPVWDPERQRIWFLSDRDVGVRALRVYAIDWPQGGLPW